MTPEFNAWWDSDATDDDGNEYRNDSAAYWAWEGWKAALASKPTGQVKPVPLTEDDPLQGAVDWLLKADGEYFCVATVQRTLRIGYNRAKRLADVARDRATGAAHGIAAATKEQGT